MSNFNMQNIKHVAKWDLTINRSFYLRAWFIIFVYMGFDIIENLWVMSYSMAGHDLFQGMAPGITLSGASTVDVLGKYFTMLPFLLGFTFHNLRTKQGRIKEFMLPATNKEKFFWHTGLVVIGSLVVCLINFVVLDLIQMLFTCIAYGFQYTHSMAFSLVDAAQFIRELYHELTGEQALSVLLISSVVTTGYIALCSTFLLGNALYYRSNIVKTIAFHIVFFICAATLTVISLSNFQGWWWGRVFYEDTLGASLLSIAFLLVTLGCWWQSYRLYCRAQLTSSRNR